MAVRVVHNATSGQTRAVAPMARSVCAILLAIGVADDDLDGVVAVLSDPARFPEDEVPETYREIAQQAKRAHKLYLQDLMRAEQVVDAAVSSD